jgi:hypothetical protein
VTAIKRNKVELSKIISIPYRGTQNNARIKVEETFYVIVPFSAVPRSKNQCGVHVAAQHRRAIDAAGAAPGLGAIFEGGAVPPAVPVSTVASGATDAYPLGGNRCLCPIQ